MVNLLMQWEKWVISAVMRGPMPDRNRNSYECYELLRLLRVVTDHWNWPGHDAVLRVLHIIPPGVLTGRLSRSPGMMVYCWHSFGYFYCMPDELTIRTYKFEVMAEQNAELNLPEVLLFRSIFGAAHEQDAVDFVNEMFALWKDKNLLNSPVDLTYKVNLESYTPNSN